MYDTSKHRQKGNTVALKLDDALADEYRSCSFKKLRDSLPDEDQAVIDTWLDKKVIPYRVFSALKKEGYKIGKQVVYEHMNGWCICGSK